MQFMAHRAKLSPMATQGYPLLVLYCPYCREGSEAAVSVSLACPHCGRPRLRFSGANWATRSGEPPVTDALPLVRYAPAKRPVAVDESVRNMQLRSLR